MKNQDDLENLKLYKIVKQNDNQQKLLTENIIHRLMNEKTYFFSENFFQINFIEFNNLKNYNPINLKIDFLFSRDFDYGKIQTDHIRYIDEIEEEECKNCQLENFYRKKFQKKLFFNDDLLIEENDNSIFKETNKCNCDREKTKSKPKKEKDMRLVISFINYLFYFFLNF
jgi:hypothetical protein